MNIPDDLKNMHEAGIALAGGHGSIQGHTLRRLVEELAELRAKVAAPVVISEDVDERMDRLHVLAEHFVSTYETMTDSGSRGENEDHFWSAREECMKALSALEAASLPLPLLIKDKK